MITRLFISDGKDVQPDHVAEKLWGEILERTARIDSREKIFGGRLLQFYNYQKLRKIFRPR